MTPCNWEEGPQANCNPQKQTNQPNPTQTNQRNATNQPTNPTIPVSNADLLLSVSNAQPRLHGVHEGDAQHEGSDQPGVLRRASREGRIDRDGEDTDV